MITFTITPDEAQIIMNSLDLATRNGGLEVAGKILPLASKLSKAAIEHRDREAAKTHNENSDDLD